MRLAVTGASGRMGGEVLAAAADRAERVVLAVSSEPDAVGPTAVDADTEIVPDADLADALAAHEVDVLVDFTAPSALVDYAAACADAGVALVTGTTGLTDDHRGALADAADAVPVLHAPNFSKGVAVLTRLVGEAAGALADYDVELVEAHHDGKTDAPSGTALSLLDAVDDVRGESPRVHGREGEAPRAEDEVGVHAVRAGDVTGVHEVWLAGGREELRLTHRAESRRVFAEGALDAAAWLAGRDAGQYEFEAVLEVDA
ncbi:4-hydroxy-tetrahydrodipicolinate reductase [Haloarchaeobius iranensis]|uniref:4-hydroxy-tetrahydrodipicolinate reductase n=1 Tax=Haloarchaeobius iranensis TaxID=996166 RepID=A0A1G9YFC7_9EURY|nr:dihydrodipicolinate reductase [Haloarchaeobius iranensis]